MGSGESIERQDRGARITYEAPRIEDLGEATDVQIESVWQMALEGAAVGRVTVGL